jgi:hypothetical protein
MEENEEREARKKLAEIFEGMGGEITGWLLREGYFPELAFMVATHELSRQKLTTPIKLYEEKFSDKRYGLILGRAMLAGFINFNPEVVKELFEYYKEEHEKAKNPLQASKIEEADIFDRICKYHKEKNRHELLRCLWDALKQEDTEAIAEAAKSAEALGIPKGVTKVIIHLFAKEWDEQKNHRALIDMAFSPDLLEYVKEYLNPEFVKTREGHRN